mmetsp:Transcript_16203/g.61765  ORF Transcript_16203/g.61765 Transcript_16203/m.61765 type:complete len:250 (-) Transcript_16203:13-762(-)
MTNSTFARPLSTGRFLNSSGGLGSNGRNFGGSKDCRASASASAAFTCCAFTADRFSSRMSCLSVRISPTIAVLVSAGSTRLPVAASKFFSAWSASLEHCAHTGPRAPTCSRRSFTSSRLICAFRSGSAEASTVGGDGSVRRRCWPPSFTRNSPTPTSCMGFTTARPGAGASVTAEANATPAATFCSQVPLKERLRAALIRKAAAGSDHVSASTSATRAPAQFSPHLMLLNSWIRHTAGERWSSTLRPLS